MPATVSPPAAEYREIAMKVNSKEAIIEYGRSQVEEYLLDV